MVSKMTSEQAIKALREQRAGSALLQDYLDTAEDEGAEYWKDNFETIDEVLADFDLFVEMSK